MAVAVYVDPSVAYSEQDVGYNGSPSSGIYNHALIEYNSAADYNETATFGAYNSGGIAYNEAGVLYGGLPDIPDYVVTGHVPTLASVLNSLAGTTNLDAQGAAQVWTGTVLDLVGALNVAAGTSGLDLLGVLNRLAGTTGLDQDAAAASILV